MSIFKNSLINRRHFLKNSISASCAIVVSPLLGSIQKSNTVMTVTGEMLSENMGVTLSHEHVLVDFIGAAEVSPNRYNRREVFTKTLPYLKQAKELGCKSFIDCTPAYLARDPQLLKQLAEATGLHILTNTGYYGARNDECLPPHAFTETSDQLAGRWIKEFREGIEGTGIRPGFIKIGVDEGTLSDIDRKLVQAAVRTHLQTGLTIAAHTGKAAGAMDQLTVLQEAKVHPSAWIWVHAQAEQDMSFHAKAAKAGGWVSFDGLGWNSTDWHVELVRYMKKQDLLNHVLVSHDAGWYHVGEPDGGKFAPFDKMFTEFIPALQQKGFTQKEIDKLIIQNPRAAFTIRIRKA